MKTLKPEEIDARRDRDLAAARASLARFIIEEVCDRQRLHTALAYRAPATFEGITGPHQPAVPNSVSQLKGAVHWAET